MVLFFADDLATPAHPGTPEKIKAPRYALSTLAVTLAGFAVTGPLGVHPAWVAVAGVHAGRVRAAAQSAAVPLSSVRQPRQALGRRAAELLFAEIDDADAGRPHTHQQERFTPELVIRRSTALQLAS